MDSLAGRSCAHYQILEKLGEGGMGVVYRARDTRLNRLVALKFLPGERSAEGAQRARFIQEAQTASALNHPNIVTIYEIGRDSDSDYIAMELVTGRTLDCIGGPRLKLGEILKAAVQIADALAVAHRAGIVHRDLKPSNVMVTDSGVVKVLDFGLAKLTETTGSEDERTRKLAEAGVPLTEQGAILGTVAYMSPEQAEGRKIDARSDIFSFGSLLYEMVTARRAFQGDTKLSTLSAILREDPKPVSQSGAHVPRDLEKIIARCLRKDPARRFQHMDDVKVALEELKEESDSGHLFDVVPAPPAGRLRKLVMPGAAAGLALIAVAAMFLWQSRKDPGSVRTLALRQVTEDPGLTTQPAISPDGNLISYTSNRAGEGNLDIWVQQLSRGAQPIRLTKHKADDSFPSFSPDGGQIVFSSDREGGGIYIMPALGGEERLVLRGSLLRPRFSPDGQWIVTGPWASFASKLLVVPASGGTARRIAEDFYSPSNPVWSPDGKMILFEGRKEPAGEPDWWVVPVAGGPAVRTGAAKLIGDNQAGAAVNRLDQPLPAPAEWIGDSVLYSTGNIWRVSLSHATLKALGRPERLTTSSALEIYPRAVTNTSGNADNEWKIVFAAAGGSTGLWSLPVDSKQGSVMGEPVKLMADRLYRTSPSLSADESRLCYVFRDLDGYGVRVRNMKTGAETTLLRSPVDVRAKLSPDGSTVAWNPTGANDQERVINLVSASGGESRKFCESCGLIYSWTPDGKSIVYRTGNPMQFFIVDATTAQRKLIVSHPKHHLHAAQYSSDGRWVAIHFGPGLDAPRGLFIAPLREGKAPSESEWIPIMHRPGIHRNPWWSPDRNTLYFLSNAEGQYDMWSQRLDAATKHPVGEPSVVYRPQAGRLQLETGPYFGPATGRGRLIFPQAERTANIWIAE